MGRSAWMFTGDVRAGMAYEMRPGVERDRYSHPDELVWRYMPAPYFIDAIETGTLFFTRLSEYATKGDRLEGSTPRPFADAREAAFASRGANLEAYREESARFWLQMLQTVLVNCWHKREHESAPMWERYGRGIDAVAVVSTLDRLVRAMPEAITVGHVDYVDFGSEPTFYANVSARAFMKTKALEDEREVRAVLVEPPQTENGRWSISIKPDEQIGHRVSVDMSALLTRVVLSPLLPPVRSKIEDVLARASLGVPIVASELSEPPRY